MMFRDIDPRKYGEKVDSITSKLAIPADFVEPIGKSSPFFVQLLGEKAGLSKYDPSVAADPSKGIPNFDPIMYKEYEKGADEPCSIVMIRANTSTMAIPQPFLPSFTDDPHKAHPDEHSRVVREVVAASRGDPPAHGFFTMDLEKAKWLKHCSFRKKVMSNHLPALLCESYYAVFKEVDREGRLLLDGLTSDTCDGGDCTDHIIFADSLSKRLAAGIEAVFKIPARAEDEDAQKVASHTVAPNIISLREVPMLKAAHDNARKNFVGKLDL